MQKYFSGNYVIPSPKLNEDQQQNKKRYSLKIEVFFPRNQVKTKKKKIFTAIWDYIRPEFEGFIRDGWLFLVCSSSAQISMGTCVPPRPPNNLSTGHRRMTNRMSYTLDVFKACLTLLTFSADVFGCPLLTASNTDPVSINFLYH